MDMSPALFYGLSSVIVFSALAVVLAANPIFSALFLVVTMITLAFVYFALQAYFIAGVQLAVYAGAVMVLFVMVLMLFDLKKEKEAFTKGFMSGVIKIASASFLCAMIAGAAQLSVEMLDVDPTAMTTAQAQMATTKDLGLLLFTDYIFAFEILGLLLLLIAIGVVAVSRIRGGTHAKS